jgi:integrase/recombinase XerD
MTRLHDAVSDYLTIRRALGYKLVEHQRLLPDFASFLEQAGADTITTTLAVNWAIRTNGNDSWKAARLSIVRGFARYLRTIDPATEIPPEGLLCGQPQHAIPYLYSEQEITRLLAAAAGMRPPLRAATFTTIIALLTVTGMRIGETLALDRDDVDLDAGVLTIRDTKFGICRNRHIPNYVALRTMLPSAGESCVWAEPKALGST